LSENISIQNQSSNEWFLNYLTLCTKKGPCGILKDGGNGDLKILVNNDNLS